MKKTTFSSIFALILSLSPGLSLAQDEAIDSPAPVEEQIVQETEADPDEMATQELNGAPAESKSDRAGQRRENRQDRRGKHHGKRKERRESRQERRQERRENRQENREENREERHDKKAQGKAVN